MVSANWPFLFFVLSVSAISSHGQPVGHETGPPQTGVWAGHEASLIGQHYAEEWPAFRQYYDEDYETAINSLPIHDYPTLLQAASYPEEHNPRQPFIPPIFQQTGSEYENIPSPSQHQHPQSSFHYSAIYHPQLYQHPEESFLSTGIPEEHAAFQSSLHHSLATHTKDTREPSVQAWDAAGQAYEEEANEEEDGEEGFTDARPEHDQAQGRPWVKYPTRSEKWTEFYSSLDKEDKRLLVQQYGYVLAKHGHSATPGQVYARVTTHCHSDSAEDLFSNVWEREERAIRACAARRRNVPRWVEDEKEQLFHILETHHNYKRSNVRNVYNCALTTLPEKDKATWLHDRNKTSETYILLAERFRDAYGAYCREREAKRPKRVRKDKGKANRQYRESSS